MRSDFRTMNALATYTKLDPRTRIERLKSFNTRLLREPKVVKELSEWGLKLDNNLTNVRGRVIPKEPIIMADAKVFKIQGGSWDNEIRSNKMLVTANLKDWIVIVPQRMMNEGKVWREKIFCLLLIIFLSVENSFHKKILNFRFFF